MSKQNGLHGKRIVYMILTQEMGVVYFCACKPQDPLKLAVTQTQSLISFLAACQTANWIKCTSSLQASNLFWLPLCRWFFCSKQLQSVFVPFCYKYYGAALTNDYHKIFHRFLLHSCCQMGSYHSIKLLTLHRCNRTPHRLSGIDTKPVYHFDPLLPRIVYVAWLFDSCGSHWVPVQNV